MFDRKTLVWLSLGALVLVARPTVANADDAVEQATAVEAAIDVATTVEATETSAADGESAATEDKGTGANPTHKQSALIDVNGDSRAESTVTCFCLATDDRLLVGCDADENEIRVFDADGNFLESIQLAVKPEAINVAPDGSILVAGDGKLLRLSAEGEEIAQVEAPHAAAMRESEKEIREQVIDEHKQQGNMVPQMLAAYDQAITGLEEQIEQLGDAEDAAEQRATAEQAIEMYRTAKEAMAKQHGDQEVEEAAELTEEQITEMVAQAMSSKTAVASISATEEAVFIACRTTVGYGYDVWRTDVEFADAKKIVSGLSGCCGQMDVQACASGVFVAENSKHRVCRYDAEGELTTTWGQRADSGVEGFGSCCNPMNLAFGADGVVYTAEDTTGRIKRYTADGELLSVVGAADLVPGCKKVSIGVDSTGDRVFMLDITRNHIAVLSRVAPDPTGPISDADVEGESSSGGLLRLLGFGS